MGMLNFELYEALKQHVGDRGARLIAERIPEPGGLATKADLEKLGASLTAQILELKADTRHWMLMFFVPLWIGVYGTIAAIVITHALG